MGIIASLIDFTLEVMQDGLYFCGEIEEGNPDKTLCVHNRTLVQVKTLFNVPDKYTGWTWLYSSKNADISGQLTGKFILGCQKISRTSSYIFGSSC